VTARSPLPPLPPRSPAHCPLSSSIVLKARARTGISLALRHLAPGTSPAPEVLDRNRIPFFIR